MWTALIAAAIAQTAPICETTSLGRLAAESAPAVFVLGERRGTAPDQARALKLAKKLRNKAAVTVALQAVHVEEQAVLDAYDQAQVPVDQLGTKLKIMERTGHAPDRYLPLAKASDLDMQVVAVGVNPTRPPQGVVSPQPPGYIHVLSQPMGDAPIPVELEGRYTAMVAYTDHRVAARAIEAWGGEGYLIILFDRLHAEGDKGVSWQAGLLTSAPVHNVMLKRSDSPCYPGDLHLK